MTPDEISDNPMVAANEIIRLKRELEQAHAQVQVLREALADMGTEHGCEPGADPSEDVDIMCPVCLKAMRLSTAALSSTGAGGGGNG